MLVLCVDDHADSRQLVADVISSIGLDSLTAANGPDALELALQRMPDLIILDVNMPGMTGIEVCERLKSSPVTTKIPIIMLTAMGDIDHRVRGLKAGAEDYLTKPVNPRELIERVRTRLRAKTENDELRKVQIQIRETFGRFVSASVVEELLRAPDQVQLGGRSQDVTVMFIDLEGFTSISERTEPEKLLSVLNRYHTMLVGVIREYGGTIDKFIGDGIMALYNTPLQQSDHVARAVRTALAIRRALPAFHAQFEPHFRMKINFGIHTGNAVVGNVGAPDIMNYTAVGDTVNIAARLQSASHDGMITISEAVRAPIRERLTAVPLGPLKMRGRVEEVHIYDVQSLRDEA
jgi:class 3 adenylate cyclase